ncbi:MAG: 4-hydroxy-3-methylbut-2-enyl diphosphate reductase [Methylophilaceae bacterium]
MRKTIQISLAKPRGFCAGVERAVLVVKKSLEKYGAPIYVRHEVVHNKFVINELIKEGAVFVDSLQKIPQGSHVIFSAHGVSKTIRKEANELNLIPIDATCPLVTKVHKQVNKLNAKQFNIIMIGHQGHPEVEGTLGQIEKEGTHTKIFLVENTKDVDSLKIEDSERISYVSQTTLSMDDTQVIINALKNKYPNIVGPKSNDICYATQNRQDAIKLMAKKHDLIIVVGSKNSSNSNRLVEIAQKAGVESFLIDTIDDFKPSCLANKKNIGISAGASAPEILVQALIKKIKESYEISIKELEGIEENIIFKLPMI